DRSRWSCRPAWGWRRRCFPAVPARAQPTRCWPWPWRWPDMRKLALDFQRREPPSVAGWLLLVSGLALAGILGWQQWLQWEQQQSQATRRAHVQALIGAGNAASAEAR